MSSLGYEIRNKKNEEAHPVMVGECFVRKMTAEEQKKYGPKTSKKKKGINIKGGCGWGHDMVRKGV